MAAEHRQRDRLRRHQGRPGRAARRLGLALQLGQEQRAQERIGAGRRRLDERAQAGLSGGLSIRPDADERAHGDGDRQRRCPGEKPPAHPPRPHQLGLGAGQELSLGDAKRPLVPPAPPERLVQRVAAPQQLLRPAPLLPQRRRGEQPLAELAVGPVLVEPALEQRPAGDQRLVGQLDPLPPLCPVGSDQAPGHQPLQHAPRRQRILEAGQEILPPGAIPRSLVGDEIAEHAARRRHLLRTGDSVEDLVRVGGEDSRHAPRRRQPRPRQQPAGGVAPLPQPARGQLDERQRRRLVDHGSDHLLDEPGLVLEAEAGGRSSQRLRQRVRVGRTEQHHVSRQRVAQLGVLGQPAEEIAAQGHDHADGPGGIIGHGQECLCKCPPHGGGLDLRHQLLELIDDEHDGSGRVASVRAKQAAGSPRRGDEVLGVGKQPRHPLLPAHFHQTLVEALERLAARPHRDHRPLAPQTRYQPGVDQ